MTRWSYTWGPVQLIRWLPGRWGWTMAVTISRRRPVVIFFSCGARWVWRRWHGYAAGVSRHECTVGCIGVAWIYRPRGVTIEQATQETTETLVATIKRAIRDD